MRSEEQLHRAVVDLLRIYENRGLLAFCHVGNGEWRHKRGNQVKHIFSQFRTII